MLLNAAKCQGYSFYRFWVIKAEPTVGKITPHTHELIMNFFNALRTGNIAEFFRGNKQYILHIGGTLLFINFSYE